MLFCAAWLKVFWCKVRRLAWCLLLVAGFCSQGRILMWDAFAKQQSFVVASFNLEHMMSERVFQEWAEFCEQNNWQERKDRPTPYYLPYCNAHNGLQFINGKSIALPLRDWQSFQKKIQALRQAVQKYDFDIVAVQEVTDEQALKLVFDPAIYNFYLGKKTIAQNLGFVVKKRWWPFVKFHDYYEFTFNKTKNRLRPAIELKLTTDHGAYYWLNVHLKSGCKNYLIDAPQFTQDWQRKQKKVIEFNCRILRYQAVLLKEWISIHRNVAFMLLGDFNRNFLWELRQYRQGQDYRLAGSDSLDGRNPITPKTKLGLLFFEWDAAAAGSLVLSIPKKQPSQKYRCLFGTDQVITNERFSKYFLRLTQANPSFKDLQLLVRKHEVNPLPWNKSNARASDHCLYSVHLPFVPRAR